MNNVKNHASLTSKKDSKRRFILNSFKFSLFLFVLLFSMNGFAQENGVRYVLTKTVKDNGEVEKTNGTMAIYFKFSGNRISYTWGYNNTTTYQFHHNEGNYKVYYLVGTEYTTMQSVLVETNPLLISADKNTINMRDDAMKLTMVYKKQTQREIGGMYE